MAAKLKKSEEATKPSRSKRGQSDNGETKSKPVAKKAEPSQSVEVAEPISSNCSDHDSDLETTENAASQKVAQTKTKQKSQESSAVKEHCISDDNDSEAETSEPSKPSASPSKKRNRQAAAETSNEPSKKKSKTDEGTGDLKPMLNQTTSDYKEILLDHEAVTKDGKKWNFKISSWNVAGLKAWVKVRNSMQDTTFAYVKEF